VIYTLSGRSTKLLKTLPKLYTPGQLMLLDSSFYLMANAVRRQDSLVKDKEQEVKIF